MTVTGVDAPGAARAFADPSKGYVPPWRRPRRKAYVMATIAWLYAAWSLLPVLIAVVYSFNDSRSRAVWQGFTTDWYCCGGEESVAAGASITEDPQLLLALQNSVTLALVTVLLAVPLGTALALGTTRWQSRLANVSDGVSLFPLVTPELVLGSALYVVVITLYSGIGLGKTALVLGHVTFSISYVLVIVRARLSSIGAQYETAGQDLGATRLQAIRTVLLPMLIPAILASGMITFAASLDDFIISSFLFGEAANLTVPVLLYSATRVAPTPALNALATLLLVGTLASLAVAYVVLRLRRRGSGGSALDEIAGIEM
ncbi:MAG: ABC transporter permease [Actinomycetia bacterium]|nr:ABC transporter permease [Actinomycetes bacterium]